MNAYALYRIELLGRVLSEKLTPENVAAELQEQGFGDLCRDEIAKLRGMGSRWIEKPKPLRHPEDQ